MITKAAALLAIVTLLGATPAKHYMGFSCTTLAQRQALPNAPGMTFRVLKLRFAANQPGHVMHKHKYGEILYLLAGNGFNEMSGKKTALSSDRALVVPAGTSHEIVPGAAGATLLSVQFTDTAASPFQSTNHKVPDVCAD